MKRKPYALYLLLPLLLWGLVACKKGDSTPPKFFYNYYPTTVGNFVEYEVDSMYHNGNFGSDTFYFQVREVIAEDFLDAEGRLSQRIERFKRNSSSDPWVLKDVWFSTRTGTRAEKVEENVRYVKVLFPPKLNDKWDGNLYNIFDETDYEIDQLHESTSINGFAFDSTLTVIEADRQNFVDTIYQFETYATGVGMVKRTYRDIFYAFDTAFNVTLHGSEYYQTLIGYGQ